MVAVALVARRSGLEPLLAGRAGDATLVLGSAPLPRIGQTHGAIELAIHPGAAMQFGNRGTLSYGKRIGRAVGDAHNGRGWATSIDDGTGVGDAHIYGVVALVHEHPLGRCVPEIALIRVGGVDAQVVPERPIAVGAQRM